MSSPGHFKFFYIIEMVFGFDIKRDLATDQFVCLVANNLVDFVVTQLVLLLSPVWWPNLAELNLAGYIRY